MSSYFLPQQANIPQKHEELSQQLVERLRNSDISAWESAYAAYNASMLRRAKRELIVKSDARDVVQDCWLMLFEKIATDPRNPCRLHAYLLQVVSFIALNANRKILRRKTQSDTSLLALVESPIKSPDDQVDVMLCKRVLADHISELPVARDRAILEKMLLNGESRNDVQTSMGMASVEFSKILSRARKRLAMASRRRVVPTVSLPEVQDRPGRKNDEHVPAERG